MAKQTINVGVDTGGTGANKINSNFTELYNSQTSVSTDITNIKTDVTNLQNSKADISTLNTEITDRQAADIQVEANARTTTFEVAAGLQDNIDLKQDILTTDNAGDNITITEIGGIVKINSTGGSGGTTNHASLENLSYESSGHTGFATSAQGTKADSAIQNIIAGTNVSVSKSGTNYTISASVESASTNTNESIYINTGNTLTVNEPTVLTAIPFALTTTSPVTKTFTFTFPNNAVISKDSRYGFWANLSGLVANTTYVITTDWTQGSNAISFGQFTFVAQRVSQLIFVPMNVNYLTSSISVTAGQTAELDIFINRIGGTSHTVNLNADPNVPSTFERNGGNISTDNVFGLYNGAVQSQTYINLNTDTKFTNLVNGLQTEFSKPCILNNPTETEKRYLNSEYVTAIAGLKFGGALTLGAGGIGTTSDPDVTMPALNNLSLRSDDDTEGGKRVVFYPNLRFTGAKTEINNIQFEKQLTVNLSTNNTAYLTNINHDLQPLVINCPNGAYIEISNSTILGIRITPPTTGNTTILINQVRFGTYNSSNWNIPLNPNLVVVFYNCTGTDSLPNQANIVYAGGNYRPINYTRTTSDPSTPDPISQNFKGIDNKIGIINSRIASENINIYVSTTGNDTTGDGTSGKPFATIQKAIDVLPKFGNGKTATINVGGGTYSAGAVIDTMIGYGSLSIKLQGDVTFDNTTISVTRTTYTVLDSSTFTFTFNNTDKDGVVASYGSLLRLFGNFVFTSPTTNSRNSIYSLSDSNIIMNSGTDNIVANNQTRVVYASQGRISISPGTISGTNNSKGFSAFGGVIYVGNTTLVANTKVEKTGGGQVLTGAGVDLT